MLWGFSKGEKCQEEMRKITKPISIRCWIPDEGKGRDGKGVCISIYTDTLNTYGRSYCLVCSAVSLLPLPHYKVIMKYGLKSCLSDFWQCRLHLSCIAFAVVALAAQDTCQWWAGPEGFRPVNTKKFLELATCTTLCWQGRSYLPVQDISKFNSTYQVC